MLLGIVSRQDSDKTLSLRQTVTGPAHPQPMNVLNCSRLGTGSLNGNFGHLLFKFDDSLLLTADQVLEGFDFFQYLLQLGFRFLWGTQDPSDTF